jgi:hypothetical protein
MTQNTAKTKIMGIVDSGALIKDVLNGIKVELESRGYVLDPDKVFGGGVQHALWLSYAASKMPLALAAFVWGVLPGDSRLYGKAWAPVVLGLARQGLLPDYHAEGYMRFQERIGLPSKL